MVHFHADHSKNLPKISEGEPAQRKDSFAYRIMDQRKIKHVEDREEMPRSS